ncbi:MAG: PhzF family phenazine biosynthesis protein [Pseudomonadota bacterium]
MNSSSASSSSRPGPGSSEHRFSQVDVFSGIAHGGNPVAVVHDAGNLSDGQMAAFARWTNLSETTFLLPAEAPGADYRLRIFTPGGELPFAGHPTLGSCHAWLEAGGVAQNAGAPVQECAVGLVELRRLDGRLAFAAPPLRRSGPLEPEVLEHALTGSGVSADRVLDHQWVDNGPGWCALLLQTAVDVLGAKPDFARLRGLNLGLVGAHGADSDVDFEVRAFVPDLGVPEDPVTGSLNASIGQWLTAAGIAPTRYIAAQGTVLGRQGRVFVQAEANELWIGGETSTAISGSVSF